MPANGHSTLYAKWLQRCRERHQLAELGQRMLRHIEVPRSAPIQLSNKLFWKE
jgi:hypothetical protein